MNWNFFKSKWSGFSGGIVLALVFMLALFLFGEMPGLGDGMKILSRYCKDAVDYGELDRLPPLDWEVGLIIGLFIGGLAGTLASGEFKFMFFNEDGGPFSGAVTKTVLVGILGGALMTVAVQLAGNSVFGFIAEACESSSGAWLFILVMTVSASAFTLVFGGGSGSGGGSSTGSDTAGKSAKTAKASASRGGRRGKGGEK